VTYVDHSPPEVLDQERFDMLGSEAFKPVVGNLEVVEQQGRYWSGIRRQLTSRFELATVVASLSRRGKDVIDASKVWRDHVFSRVFTNLAVHREEEIYGESTIGSGPENHFQSDVRLVKDSWSAGTRGVGVEVDMEL